MAEIYNELTIVIKSVYRSPADSSVGIFSSETLIEEIEIYDGDKRIKNDSLEEYFLKNYQAELIEALDKEERDNLI